MGGAADFRELSPSGPPAPSEEPSMGEEVTFTSSGPGPASTGGVFSGIEAAISAAEAWGDGDESGALLSGGLTGRDAGGVCAGEGAGGGA